MVHEAADEFSQTEDFLVAAEKLVSSIISSSHQLSCGFSISRERLFFYWNDSRPSERPISRPTNWPTFTYSGTISWTIWTMSQKACWAISVGKIRPPMPTSILPVWRHGKSLHNVCGECAVERRWFGGLVDVLRQENLHWYSIRPLTFHKPTDFLRRPPCWLAINHWRMSSRMKSHTHGRAT